MIMEDPAREATMEEDKMEERGREEVLEEIHHEFDAYVEPSTSSSTTTSYLAKLNLILVLSFVSLSPEECKELEEMNENNKNDQENDSIPQSTVSSRLKQRRRQEMSKFSFVRGHNPRVQSKIKDCRHCRKM